LSRTKNSNSFKNITVTFFEIDVSLKKRRKQYTGDRTMGGGGEALGGGGHERRGSKANKRKKKKRVGFRLDMTPLVDIAFLLLTFFMFTTTMITPQVMEMSIPPSEDNVQVKESDLFNIFIRKDGKMFIKEGIGAATPLEMKNLRAVVVNKHRNHPVQNDVITVLKVAKDANYGMVVNVLDELNLAESDIIQSVFSGKGTERKRKFTLAAPTDEELVEIEKL
jgi:biopolymer transport protein ExbD